MENRFYGNGGSAQFKRGGSLLADSRVDDTYSLNAPDYNKHDLSHVIRFSAKIGECIPHKVLTIPGDKFKVNANTFIQYQASYKPILDKLDTKLHYFYVPQEMVEDNFELFYTKGKDGLYKRERPYFSLSLNAGQIYKDGECNLTDYPALWNIAIWIWNNEHNTTISSTDIDGDGAFALNILDNAFGKGSLLDFLDLGRLFFTPNVTDGSAIITQIELMNVNSIVVIPIAPLLAYQRIWNDFYRKEDIVEDMFFEPTYKPAEWQKFASATISGWPDSTTRVGWCLSNLSQIQSTPYGLSVSDTNCHILVSNNVSSTGTSYSAWYSLAFCLCKRPVPYAQDYYTTALPFTQRGIVQSLKTSIFVTPTTNFNSASVGIKTYSTAGKTVTLNAVTGINAGSSMSSADVYSSFTWNDIRELSAYTRYYERAAVSGYTFDERLYAEFGISADDYKFKKPTYLGGFVVNSTPSKIQATSDSDDGLQVGDYRGQSNAVGSDNGSMNFEAENFGYFFTFVTTSPKTSYSNVRDVKEFYLKDSTCLFTPEFAHLTEQPLFNAEMQGSLPMTSVLLDKINGVQAHTSTDIIGYVPRYNNYRYEPDRCYGELNKYDGGDSYFSMARDYSFSDPKLNQNLLYCSVDDSNVTDCFLVHQDYYPTQTIEINYGISALRKIPRISLPVVL